MRSRKLSMLICAVAVGSFAATSYAAPVGTAFTYQGQLKEGGRPVNGACDFEFGLWAAQSGGIQIGPLVPVAVPADQMVNGLFTASLDFGPGAFNGDVRWLEIAVRCPAGVGVFATLSGRQELTPAPSAIFAANAVGGGGNTLDQAYDEGGAGAGRTITADAGPVDIFGPDGLTVNGNVGIGTAVPNQRLHVAGNARIEGRTIYSPGTGPLMTAGHNNGVGNEKRMWIGHSESFPTWGIQYRDLPSDGLFADSIEFVSGDTTKPRVSFQLFTGVMRLFDASAQATVWIDPNAGGGGAGVLLSNSAGSNTIELDADENDDGVIRLFDAAGNTGVSILADGTNAAGRVALFNDGGQITVDIVAAEGLTNNGAQIMLRKADGTTTIEMDSEKDSGASVISMRTSTGTETIRLRASETGDGSDLNLMNAAGQVTVQLDADVSGTGVGRVITDVLEITGADLAEKFPVSEEVKPGMVVAIDPDHAGKLCVARGVYNRRVAGVVSGANGFSVGVILGNLPGHDDAPPIAMSGRVYVLADASNGPIQPGDMLTTAAVPGHAMKVTDFGKAQGAVLGKAMSSMTNGQGLVLVLVSLQ